MISRIWHGYTTPENAEAYEKLLKEEIFTEIKNRKITGYKGIQLLRRQVSDEVEFITIMWFDSLDSIRLFAGENYENAVIPEKARKILVRYDKQSQHYDVKI
jgi:antibiotic biosynthesis monooxygenase (ABM) superfamily enzyme